MTSTDVRPHTLAQLRFPPGFTFGAATASYQIEGSVDADGRGRSIWDTFSHTPGRTHLGHTGDVADDHYRRYREDVALMAELGIPAYRFSVAWPRVLPEGAGRVEQRGLDFYRRLVDELLDKGIDPWLTLYHWDLPQTLEDGGGWAARDTAARFADYAAVVVDALGDRVRHWSTLNEPFCSALIGYQAGLHAPGDRNPVRASRAVHHLLLGHGLAAQVLRDRGVASLGDRVRHWSTLNEPFCSALIGYQAGLHAPGDRNPVRASRAVHHLLLGHGLAAQVLRDRGVASLGITLNFTPISPASDSPVDVDAARRLDGQQNRMFLEAIVRGAYPADVVEDLARAGAPLPVEDGDLDVIAAPLDWLGVNYYFTNVVRGGRSREGEPTPFIGAEDVVELDPEGPTTTMGWNVDPDGFTGLLLWISERAPGLPLVVTENGSAWPDTVSEDGLVHDPERTDYLLRHLQALTAAVAEGADVRGYFAWSLLDNFEWARGYDQRFGLVYVDYETQARIPKDTAHAYAEVLRRHRGAGG